MSIFSIEAMLYKIQLRFTIVTLYTVQPKAKTIENEGKMIYKHIIELLFVTLRNQEEIEHSLS